MDKYELVRDLGAGNFGVARLLRHKETKELVAMKYIPRGQKVGVVSLYLPPCFDRIAYFPCGLLLGVYVDRRECGERDHQSPVASAP